MDLSFLKWPLIIGGVVLVGWLASSGGVNYMYKKFTVNEPGADAKKDQIDEAGLSRLGGYCLMLFKYEKAMSVYETAVSSYPDGKNVWYNKYQMARCAERLGDYRKTVDILHELIDASANDIDERVPNNDNLRLRSEKLIEMHELEKR
jgi:tetratricopeptide (TPR) repeat protein